MRQLPLTIPLQADETPMSFVSRLAARNGTKARTFCHDFGLRFQDVVDGAEETLRQIARLAGIDPRSLLANAFVKSAPLQWTFRGQILHRTALRRERIAVCPACILADIQAAPALRPPVAAHGRAIWLLDVVRTCPDHRRPLVAASEDLRSSHLHDFTHHLTAILPRLADIPAGRRRDLGAVEIYARSRLDGRAASPLLDPMPLAAAVRLCETAGAVALFGPKVDLKKLSEEQRRAAGSAGFEAIGAGPEALHRFLSGLMGRTPLRNRVDGPGVAFGRLNTLFDVTKDDPAFDQARAVVRTFIVENFAVENGRALFGKPAEGCRIHTLHTLAKDTGVHPKTLRKHLRAAGLVTEAQMAMSDNNIRIDAEQALEIAGQLQGTLSLAEAMAHISAPRTQMDVLVKAGIIKPQQRMTGFGAQNRYTITDLDAFIAGLVRKQKTTGRPSSFCAIPTAAKRSCCSAAEIVRLILAGKVRTHAAARMRGYMSVMVDPVAVAKALQRPEATGLSLRKAARELGTSDDALEALIAEKHITCFVGINPVNRCPQRLVAAKEVKRFKAQYVSLWTLSKERGVYIATLKTRLDRAGVKPAFDPLKIGARFYRRNDWGNRAEI